MIEEKIILTALNKYSNIRIRILKGREKKDRNTYFIKKYSDGRYRFYESIISKGIILYQSAETENEETDLKLFLAKILSDIKFHKAEIIKGHNSHINFYNLESLLINKK